MDLKELRNEIDHIDEQLLCLFLKRMEISSQVADYKLAHDLPVFVPEREQAILRTIAEKAGPDLAKYSAELYTTIFRVSRDYQTARMANREVVE